MPKGIVNEMTCPILRASPSQSTTSVLPHAQANVSGPRVRSGVSIR